MHVSVIDANGCEASAEFIFTGLHEEIHERVSVFPNPATDKLYLDLSGVNSKIESLQLISINGQSIRPYSKNDIVLDISQGKSGVHVLQILFEDGSWANKRVLVLR